MEIPDGPGLTIVDWSLLITYAIATLVLGWYFGRRKDDGKSYFLGSGKMNPLLIGVSLFATLLSTISYLSVPGEALGKGPAFVLASITAAPLSYLIVSRWILPIYMRHRVTSAYELLEQQLGSSVRLLGASLFVTLRLVWMSLLVFLSAKAMLVMLGVGPEWTPVIVVVTGLVSVIYTSLGGLRAVVITDLLQTLLLFGGALLVLAIITIDFGGLGWFPTTWDPNWDTQPFFSFDPKTRVTFVGAVVSIIIWNVCTAGGDQTTVQRFMATGDRNASQRAYMTQLLVSATVLITLALVGLALLAYFQQHPTALPQNISIKQNADFVFPRFISHHLPPGVTGLVIAAMFAAAMSSIDSGVNSITAVVSTDFLPKLGKRFERWRQQALYNQVLAFLIGTVVVIGSSFVGNIPNNITGITQKTSNLLVTPIFALFVYALFIPRSTAVGVWAGTIAGVTVAIIVAFSGSIVLWLHQEYGIAPENFGVALETTKDVITGAEKTIVKDPISFQWIGLLALLANFGVGLPVSYATGSTTSNPQH